MRNVGVYRNNFASMRADVAIDRPLQLIVGRERTREIEASCTMFAPDIGTVRRAAGRIAAGEISGEFPYWIAAGARFGDPLQPYTVDQVASALEVQARWHGQTWGATPARFPQLHRGAWGRKPAASLLGETHWRRVLPQLHAMKLPDALPDRPHIAQALDTLWRLDDSEGVPCMAHVDAHLGNTYLDAHHAPRFIDWQSASLSPGIDDAAYFMSGALSIADRRGNERELLRHYLEALVAHGAPQQSFDIAWLGYRRHLIHGFLWAVTPPEMQSPERVTAMSSRHLAAIADHDTLRLLMARRRRCCVPAIWRRMGIQFSRRICAPLIRSDMDLPAKLADNLAFMIHRTALDYEVYFDNEMHTLGLTRSQWLLLSHLYFCEGINQKELGELMGIGKGAIGRLAYKLESGGWIERKPDQEDRRAFRLHIREQAKPLVKKLVDMLILETDRSVEGIAASEVETVRRFLRKISRNIGVAPVSARWRALKKQLLADVKQLKR